MIDLKKKITELSKGEFHFPQHEVIFPETRLIMRVGEGEIYSGSFSLQNQGEGTVRGLVYPSSFRVRCGDTGFDDNPVNIHYTYDGTGLLPGHVEHGTFTIVSNGGEYDIAFTAIIEKPFVMTSHGKVGSLEGFKKLAFRDPLEAKKLFVSRDFYTILKYEDSKILALYDNMRKWELDQQAVEEFLVACKQKEKIFLTLEEESRAFISLEETRKETLVVKKNTWGFLPIDIYTNGDFLHVENPYTNTEEFIGNSYRLEYYIHADQLHDGSNFGEIVLITPYESLSYEVVVERNVKRDEDYRAQDKKYAALLRSYLDFEAGVLDMQTWQKEAVETMEQLREMDANNEMYLLNHANILLIGGKTEEARWILESYNYNRFSTGKNIELSSYYLYLTAFLSNDSLGQRRVAEELSRSYMKNPDNWKILCMLVQTDSEYKIFSERLRVLESLFYKTGAGNVLFFLEAFKCFRDKTHSLKKLGVFEVRVLHFGVKHNLMTKELALYTANLASQLKGFDLFLYRTLVLCYETYAESMILSSICTLLIKGNHIDYAYFQWYEKAVIEELKIAQLYEYYISSLDVRQFHKALPRTVYLYFMHGNSLGHQKLAFLYANIITFEDESSEIYSHYRDEMEVFAWGQLERRNISEQLRIVYKRFIHEGVMNKERVEALYDVCHAYEITTTAKNMKVVHVIGEDGTVTQSAHYAENGAKIYLYSKKDRIVWESIDGRHFPESIPYSSRRLFFELRYLDMCRKYFKNTKLNRSDMAPEPLTLETVRERGPDYYRDDELLGLSSRVIRETNYESSDFLTYLCFRIFEKEQYDKITLTYLAKYYSGATIGMRDLWKKASEWRVPTHELSERILSQMLFTDCLFMDLPIFEAYYAGGAYFRLQQAYLAYVSREYVVEDRVVAKNFFDIICKEFDKGEEIQEISKIAALKYYATKKYDSDIRRILKKFLQELCGRQIYFPFFLKYEEEWLIELQLWDKTLIQYKGQKGSRVVLYYKLQRDDSELVDYSTEVLTPMYENIFVKKIVLFSNEQLKYYFKETIGNITYRSEKRVSSSKVKSKEVGRYGRLNGILQTDKKKQGQAMKEYAVEDAAAMRMFEQY